MKQNILIQNSELRDFVEYYRRKKYTYKKIAEKIGISESHFCNIRKGRRNLSIDKLGDVFIQHGEIFSPYLHFFVLYDNNYYYAEIREKFTEEEFGLSKSTSEYAEYETVKKSELNHAILNAWFLLGNGYDLENPEIFISKIDDYHAYISR